MGGAEPIADSRPELPFREVVIDRDNPMQPHCKTVGDVNGDGRVDILAASAFGQGLFWYEDPNWIKHRIDTGSFTTDMQAGDVDGDGDVDVIIPKVGTGMVWYENPRPGGHPARDAWRIHRIDAQGGHDVEVGDVDADGRLDVVVRQGETRVFFQGSPGVWRRVVIPTTGRGGTVLGDLDGDGDLDIAQNGYWLETPADKRNGEWTRHEIASGWPDDCGVHIVRLNDDKRMDVLLAPAEAHGRLSWFEAADPKKGPWIEHVIDPRVAYIHTFKTADMDRDGLLDVITSEMEQSPLKRVTIYYNRGGAIRWQAQVVGRLGSHNLRVADLGNDGDLDIVGANHGNYGGATPIMIWENLSNQPAPTLALDRWDREVIDADRPWRAIFISAGDLDDDGRKDVVSGGWWYRNPGSPGAPWDRREIGSPLNNMAAVYDFDGDGDWDVLGTEGKGSESNARFVWGRNDGKGGFTILTNIAMADGDFLQGIAVAQFKYRRIDVALSWHRAGRGIQVLTVPAKPTEMQWTWRRLTEYSQDEMLSVGHIDRDAVMDLLLGTRWLRNSGSLQVLHPTPGDPDRNRLADINGDGLLDAVVGFEAINIPGKLAWYQQREDPAAEWTEHLIASVVGPMSMDAADLDRDGDWDVVVGEHNYRQPATAKLHVFENRNGKGGEWKDHVVSIGDEHHVGAVVTDIDNDGDLDILSIGWSHPRVLLYRNRALP